MRVLLLTVGSRGDVEPFLALAAGLRQAGHEPTLAAARRFEADIRAQGVGFAPLGDGFLHLLDSAQGRTALERMRTFGGTLRTLRQLAREVAPMQLQMQRDAWAAAQASRPDVVVHHLKLIGAPDIAQILGVPAVMALLVPALQPTRALGCPLLPPMFSWPLLRQPGYALVNRLATLFGAAPVRRWRSEVQAGPRAARSDLLHDANGQPLLLLHAHSELLVPRPQDWPAHAQVTGFWRLPATDWTPPTALAEFLDAGAPPVYVGFGSMAGRRPERLRDIVVEAIGLAGVRAVVSTGWGGLPAQGWPAATVHVLESAPHDALFPRLSAVVHHGGAGTTAAAAIAGRPQLVCPFFGDQPFWGRRVQAHGLGPPPLPQHRLCARSLATALRRLQDDPALALAAATLGRRLREEHGVRRAVSLLEALVEPPRGAR